MYLYEKQQLCTHSSLHYEILDNCVKKCSKSEVAPRSEVAPSDGTLLMGRPMWPTTSRVCFTATENLSCLFSGSLKIQFFADFWVPNVHVREWVSSVINSNFHRSKWEFRLGKQFMLPLYWYCKIVALFRKGLFQWNYSSEFLALYAYAKKKHARHLN